MSVSGEMETLAGLRGSNIHVPFGYQILNHRGGSDLRGLWTVVLRTLSLGHNYLQFSCEHV